MSSWRWVGLGITACVVALALLAPGGPAQAPDRDAPTRSEAAPARDDVRRAVAVLTAWDERRAAAWAAVDASALRALYAPGSSAGRADVRLLRRWRDAGWRVEWLTTQLVSVRVRLAAARRLELRVVDRLAGGRLVSRAGDERVLPGTPPRARSLVLERRGGDWRVSASGAAPPPRPP
ncbi:hypothetical protein [Nocardioides aequoreus]|uniref:hypothetical protein n=1 Tax=Nocardioides aequoreus TaxID=397278 RepID=UPI0004C310AF|nr:hypothetical protein [Nocardioides aequoreus]